MWGARTPSEGCCLQTRIAVAAGCAVCAHRATCDVSLVIVSRIVAGSPEGPSQSRTSGPIRLDGQHRATAQHGRNRGKLPKLQGRENAWGWPEHKWPEAGSLAPLHAKAMQQASVREQMRDAALQSKCGNQLGGPLGSHFDAVQDQETV